MVGECQQSGIHRQVALQKKILDLITDCIGQAVLKCRIVFERGIGYKKVA